MILPCILSANLLLANAAPPIDFDTEIVPVFTRAGCNAGACHGGAAGRGGFKLSLLGGDPAADYVTIVKEYEGRRINLAAPDRSLLLLKPTGGMDHGGDVRLEYGGPGATLIEHWIRAGAPRLQLRSLENLEVTPDHHVAERVGEEVRLRAVAWFDDGTRRDVTRWTAFVANDASRLKIEDRDVGRVDGEDDPVEDAVVDGAGEDGPVQDGVTEGEHAVMATTLRAGQSVVVARFLDRVVPVRITVPLGSEPIDLSGLPRGSFIDDYILETLGTLRLRPAPPASDAVYLRRARLTLTGTLPSVDEMTAFLEDRGERKRERLVDRLLASPEFTEFWSYRLSTLFRVRSLPNDERVAVMFHDWFRRQLNERTGYDELARTLLTAEGDSHEKGEAAFYRMTAGPREHAEYVSEIFLGARLKCANCHNHPLDRWTQDDYHGLAAVFARIDRSRVVELKERGEVTHPCSGLPAVPRLPGERFLEAEGDARPELARWITSAENPFFARAAVNRLWKALMGRGLVEPVDDLRATNPATHPRLLEHLARDFVEHGFDLRHTLRLIATSAAFGRGASLDRTGDCDDGRYYSHAIIAPLEPEVLADAIACVTGVADPYGDYPEGTRAISLPDPSIPARGLDLLGRCAREESCEAAPGGAGLSTELHLLNGPLINRKITAAEGRLARWIASGHSNDAIIDELYARALSRPPREDERAFWKTQLDVFDDAMKRRQALEDFLWSLLNSREFVTVH